MGRTITKSIAIIGEGETEWFYFDSLRVACRYPFKIAPDFPQHSDINHILKLVESYLNRQYDYIVCLSLIHISEPTGQEAISYAFFCL